MSADDLSALENDFIQAAQSGRYHCTPPPERNVIRASVICRALRRLAINTLGPQSLRLQGAWIRGPLTLDELTTTFGLKLDKCIVDGVATACGVHFRSLSLSGTRLKSLDLSGAHIDGNLDCGGAHFTSEDGIALNAEGLKVGGSLSLRRNFRAEGHGEWGAVRLANSWIGGDLSCSRGAFTNDGGPGLDCERMQADGLVSFEGAQVTGAGELGAVRLYGARIGGDLYCGEAHFANDSGPALQADGLTVDGSALLKDRFLAKGEGDRGAVRLVNARLGINLDCGGAEFVNESGPALRADGLKADGFVFLREGFRAKGRSKESVVKLNSAHIGRWLDLGLGKVCNLDPAGVSLDLTSAAVDTLLLPGDAICKATGNDPDSWTDDGTLGLDGFTYRTIYDREKLPRWLKWLKETEAYTAQPYQQFARVNREMGKEADARRVLIEQQNDRLDRGDLGGHWATARHRLLGLVIGYGYESWRALFGLAIVVVLAVGLGLAAGHIRAQPGRYVAAHTAGTAHPGSPCSTVEQLGLGLDLALPVIKVGTNNHCDLDTVSLAGQALTAAGWLLQLSAWALATLVIAGYSGLIRRM